MLGCLYLLSEWFSASLLTLIPRCGCCRSSSPPAGDLICHGLLLLRELCLVAGPAILTAAPSELFIVAYYDLIWVNIGWGRFQLVTILPLDGGNVLLTVEGFIGTNIPVQSFPM